MREFRFLPAYAPLFYSDKMYYLISGGRGSGKSTNCAAYLLIKLLSEEPNRIVVSRYTMKSITSSIYQDILDLIESWGVSQYLKITGDQIINTLNGNILMTHSVKISDASQTARSKGLANFNILFIDEFMELREEPEFIKLIDSFRVKDRQIKIIMAFNPGSKESFQFKRWYLPNGNPNLVKWGATHEFIHTTYKDNIHNLNPAKVKEWEDAAISDEEYYKHYILGEWQEIGQGAVYKHFQWGLPPEFKKEDFKEILYGLDFGFASDPSAIIRVYRNNKTLYLEEVIYERGLILEELAELMKKRAIPLDAKIIADAAEPRSIETLKRLGFRNIQPCIKGPDSIRIGIDKVKSYTVYADPNSKNLISEVAEYIYNHLGKPVGPDHLLDSLRYSLSESSGSGTYGFAGNQTRRDWSRG